MRRTHPALEALRATALLLLVPCLGLLLACGDSSPSAPSGPPTGTPSTPGTPGTPGAAIPDSVAGNWKAGTISALGFWDTHTGEYEWAGHGYAVFFTFEPDGSYKMFLYFLVRSYGCVMETWTEMDGTVTFGDGTFVTHATEGHQKAADTCNAHNNFERPATTDELAQNSHTFYWAFEPDGSGKTYMRIGFDLENRDSWNWFARYE